MLHWLFGSTVVQVQVLWSDYSKRTDHAESTLTEMYFPIHTREFLKYSSQSKARLISLSWSNVSNMLYIDNPTQVGFSYSVPINGYVDASSGSIITLPDAVCPDYAQDSGTCGTYSYPNETLTANSTVSMYIPMILFPRSFTDLRQMLLQISGKLFKDSWVSSLSILGRASLSRRRAMVDSKLISLLNSNHFDIFAHLLCSSQLNILPHL